MSADTDFGELLATTQATAPSVVLFRGQSLEVENLVRMMIGLLPEVEADLDSGAVVVIGRHRARVRRLPIGGGEYAAPAWVNRSTRVGRPGSNSTSGPA
ncbi:MAG: hypothetical protein ACFCVK_23110 [Acidimicrobiales bacterium]